MISRDPLCPTCLHAKPPKHKTGYPFPKMSRCDFPHRIGITASTGVYDCGRYAKRSDDAPGRVDNA